MAPGEHRSGEAGNGWVHGILNVDTQSKYSNFSFLFTCESSWKYLPSLPQFSVRCQTARNPTTGVSMLHTPIIYWTSSPRPARLASPPTCYRQRPAHTRTRRIPTRWGGPSLPSTAGSPQTWWRPSCWRGTACSSSVRHGSIWNYDFISKQSIIKVHTNLPPESRNRAMKPPIIHRSLSVCWQRSLNPPTTTSEVENCQPRGSAIFVV